MLYTVNGYRTIYTVVNNERIVGGAVEVDELRLRGGERFRNVVITSIEAGENGTYMVGFVTEDGRRYIAHTSDISLMVQPTHKRVKDLRNPVAREELLKQRLTYLRRVLEVNEGNDSFLFRQEVKNLVNDIGLENVRLAVRDMEALQTTLRIA
ncbi:MAG: hypothetical protein L5657_05280 [Calditerricola sp.]|jgi:hypothetical protein|nr:hypothetical protein [Calditerricola sp.]